jgi:hypothetical protein
VGISTRIRTHNLLVTVLRRYSLIYHSLPLFHYHVRHTQLWDGYFFHCTCEGCRDVKVESKLLGLKCMRCSSLAPVIPVKTEEPGPRIMYKCPNCSNNDFRARLKVMSQIEDETSKSSSLSSSSFLLETLEQDYSDRKKFFLFGFWYLQESCERLAQAGYLDALSESQDPMGQQKAGTRTGAIFEELIITASLSNYILTSTV